MDITLRGREYRVACAPEDRDALLAAVTHVEEKMTDIAARTKGSGERLAVMTALNLAHELLVKEKQLQAQAADASTADAAATNTAAINPDHGFDSPEITRRIDSMVARLDAVLEQQESLL